VPKFGPLKIPGPAHPSWGRDPNSLETEVAKHGPLKSAAAASSAEIDIEVASDPVGLGTPLAAAN
jgi:hypothetical protein